jgi:hypothetical protein
MSKQSLRGIKPGDKVFVVWGRRASGVREEHVTVGSVGRKYGYLHRPYGDVKFDLDTGLSVDTDSNGRANGRCFDVWRTEAEYREHERNQREARRLGRRIYSPYSTRHIIALPPETVQAIHELLTAAGVDEKEEVQT